MWAAQQRTFSGDGARCLQGSKPSHDVDNDEDDEDDNDDGDKDDDDHGDGDDNDLATDFLRRWHRSVSPRLEAIASATLLCSAIPTDIW